jgi:hypothetical protein
MAGFFLATNPSPARKSLQQNKYKVLRKSLNKNPDHEDNLFDSSLDFYARRSRRTL